MKEIKLKNGGVTVVDDEDYLRLSKFAWFLKKDGNIYYAVRYVWNGNRLVYVRGIHRDILNPPKGIPIDHIDHNGLNNQKSNLRVCTQQQNQANSRIKNRYGYFGVFMSDGGLYGARITENNENHILGYFKTKEEAARAYDAASLRIHGDKAVLNFK